MKEVTILLNNIDKVKNFSQKAMNLDCDLSIKAGRYLVDGKSIMGIFSLDLSNPLTLIIHSDDEEKVNKVMTTFEEFIINS